MKTKKKLSFSIVLVVALLAALVVSCVVFSACGGSKEELEVTWNYDKTQVEITVDGYDTLPAKVGKDTELVFSVTPKTGYEVNGVTGAKADGGKYKATVSRKTTIKVTSSEKINGITVEKAEGKEDVVYYAGNTVDKKDIVVTADYAVSGKKTVDSYTVVYQKGNVFALGDTKYTIKIGNATQDVTFEEAVVGLVTLKLEGGVISDEDMAKLPAGAKQEDGKVTWTFDAATEDEVELPTPVRLLDPEDETSELPFERWSGVDDNKIPAGITTSTSVTAVYETTLVDIKEMKFTTKEGKPYLSISGDFKAAKSAYLFLCEGNQHIAYDLETNAVKQEGSNSFTLDFDLLDFMHATPVAFNTEDEISKTSFKGAWMDLRFCVKIGETVLQQELFVSADTNYADLGDSIVVADGEDYYQFYYETYTPKAGDPITGGNGAVFTGTEKILKLVYKDTDPYVLSEVTLEKRGEKPYLVLKGTSLNTDKEKTEQALANVITQLQNFSGWADVDITDKQTSTVNDDLSFEIALNIENIKTSGNYVMHSSVFADGNGNFNPNNIDKEVTVSMGSSITYSLEKMATGWDWDWTSIKCVNTSYAKDKSVIVENDTPYFVLNGEAGEKTAEEIKGQITQFDFELDGGAKTVIDPEKITVTVDSGTYTVKVDISELEAGKYWVHAVGLVSGNGDIHPDASKPAATVNGKTYKGLDDQKGWGTAHLLEVTVEETETDSE